MRSMLLPLSFRFPWVLPACAEAICVGGSISHRGGQRQAATAGGVNWTFATLASQVHGNVPILAAMVYGAAPDLAPASAAFGVAIFGRAFGGLRGPWFGRLGLGLSAFCGRIGLGAGMPGRLGGLGFLVPFLVSVLPAWLLTPGLRGSGRLRRSDARLLSAML